MNWIATAVVMIFVTSGFGFPAVHADTVSAKRVEVLRRGSTPSVQGPDDNFSGSVRIDSQFQRSDPARVGGALVTFEPRARTAWHAHPLGQTLIVTAGIGWVQQWGGASQQIKEGDVVWIPPGVKHWHGAAANERMSHIAIQEALEGKVVDWMEKVSDEQYPAQGTARP